MNSKPGKRALSLFLALIMCLSLLPASALAGASDQLEAYYFDYYRQGEGGNDGCLALKDGTVSFSVSAAVAVPSADCTVSGVYLVDAGTRAERYDLLNPDYGAAGTPDVFETDGGYALDLYLQNILMPAAVGDYRLKVVTSAATFCTEEVTDEWHSTDGILHIMDWAELHNKPTIDGWPSPGTLGKPYSFTLTAAPVTEGAAITWKLLDGTLPAGLTFDEAAAAISGTPTEAGTFQFTVEATEAGGGVATRALSLYIAYPGPTMLSKSPLPNGKIDRPYSYQFEAEPYLEGGALTWSLGTSAGQLPAGLTLSENGLLSGTPTETGTFHFTPMVAEPATGVSVGATFALTVEANTAAVRFFLNGGVGADGENYDARTVSGGEAITLPAAPDQSGYGFRGWLYGGELYAAGASVTVENDMNFTAQWAERPDVPVSVPAGLELVGDVWLMGVYDGGSTARLWNQYYARPTVPEDVSIPQWMLYRRSYTRLELCARVDGVETAVAEYDGSVTAETDAVALTKTGADYTAVTGVDVTGLTAGVDCYLYFERIETGSGSYYPFFPCLVADPAKYSAKVSARYGSAAASGYDLGLNYTPVLAGDRLVITPAALPDRAAVEVTVREENGSSLSWETVSATQVINGVSRTVSGTLRNGKTTLELYAGVDAAFTVRGCGITDGGTLAGGLVAGGAHTVTVRATVLTADAALTTRTDRALVNRYLNALGGRNTLTAASGAGLDSAILPQTVEALNQTYQLTKNVAAAAVQCTLEGPGIVPPAAQTVTLTEGKGSVHFDVALRPGVVVRLSAVKTTSCILAWYGPDGAYLGSSSPFSLWGAARDIAVCGPVDASGTPVTGSVTAALLPATYFGLLSGKNLSDLSEGVVARWDVTLAEDAVAELDACRVDEIAGSNAIYVTQPRSTLQATQESFSTQGELVAFTGQIGLDDGLSGALRGITVNVFAKDTYYENAAQVECIVIDGVRYSPDQYDHCDYRFGYYNDKTLNIRLPCAYTLYCTPGSLDLDMELTVSANVTVEGNHYTDQLIGTARVARPGASLYTLSTYVCTDTVQVDGTAQPNETVTLYDGEEVIGAAVADRYGAWNAQVPLYGVDRSERMLATPHHLTAVTASGVHSQEITVIHQADGPQLLAVTMNWDDYYAQPINAGDAYTFGGRLGDPSFAAVFANPEKLEQMKEWGGARAVFKVWLTDGRVLFLSAAEETPGSFTAKLGYTLYTAVERIEVLWSPEWPRDHYDEELRCFRMEVPTREAEQFYDEALAKYNELAGLTGEDAFTPEKTKAALNEATSAESWKATFEDGAVSFSGALSEMALDADYVTDLLQAFADYGIKPRSLEQRCGEDTRNTMEWLEMIGGAARGTEECLIFNASRFYPSEQALETVEQEYAAKFARKWIESTGTQGERTAIYFFSDLAYYDENDEDAEGKWGTVKSGTYNIALEYVYTPMGVYAERISAEFYAGFDPEGGAELQSMGYAGSYTDAIKNNPQAFQNAAKPSTETNSVQNSVIDGQAAASAYQTYNQNGAGHLGNGTALVSNILTKCGSKMAGPLGLFAAWSCGSSWWEQAKSWNKNAARIWNENQKLMYVFYTPCFGKLNWEEKNAVITRYADWAVRNVGRELVDTFNFSQNTLINLVNDIILAAGLLGAIESGGTTEMAALAFTTLTTVANEAIDCICTPTLELYDSDQMISYDKAQADIDSVIRAHANDTGDEDCGGKDKKKNNVKNNQVGHDPSGVVYEGVIENPVAGATVTLWYATDALGQPVTEANASAAAQVIPAADARRLIPREMTQTTGADGRYQWGVPEGLWYVTAEYGGLTGDSGADAAASVTAADRRLLPVLPVQLDVNIPLVDAAAPMVRDVLFTTEGVYVSFSKYMVDTGTGAASVLDRTNYTLSGSDGMPISFEVEAAEQGHAPSNIDPNGTTYTRRVLLRPTGGALEPESVVSLRVSGSVKSYAGISMESDYEHSGVTDSAVILDITPTETAVNVTVSCVKNGTTVFCAFYSDDGRMLAVKSSAIDAGSERKLSFGAAPDEYRSVKVFVLDESASPLCASRTENR